MKIQRKPILEAMKRVLPCVAASDSRVEVYKCVRAIGGKFFTFDGSLGAVTTSSLPDELTFGVHAENFESVLSSMPDEFDLSLSDGNLLIKAGKSKAKLPTVKEDQDWPEFLGDNQTELLSAKNFYEALESALFCLDPNSLRSNIPPHVLLKENYLYTTDGVRAVRAKLENPVARIVRLTLPFVRLIAKQGAPDMLFEGNGIGVAYASTGTLYVSREIVAPDYSPRLEQGFQPSGQELPMPDWEEALRTVASLSKDKDDRVFAEVQDGKVRFAWDGGRGSVEEIADCPGGESFRANLRYLQQAISHKPTEISFALLPNALVFRKDGWCSLLSLHG